ncbi:hypothetical protein GcC1_184048 [Golovinomyces cichoracearum]|uniref:Uncharacterized protein n=1 Tax=Golovinomyces cichoracearum TaxID=62708 RepID=A0A420HLB2_9PEZI|nr:hypothetical protein GcC1_184048 [Golovinomyces cichoracearum]
MTNLVSLKRLNKVNIHHDSLNPLQLYHFTNNERRPWIDLTVSQSGHWVLEKISKSTENSSFGAKSSSASKKTLITSPTRWHKILGHPGVKAIESLPQNVEGCEFDSKETISTIDCESCLIAKAKATVSRRSEKNREISIINEKNHMVVVSWDIVEFITGLEGSKYMSHFYYDAESFHHLKCTKKKSGSSKKFKLTRFPSAANTPAQNGAAEISGKVIVETARTLRVAAALPKNLWPWLCESAASLESHSNKKA